MEKEKSWTHIDEVMRMARGLPFPERFYTADHVNGMENDALYINNQLSQLTSAQRGRAAMLYSEAYKGLDSRKDCNTRLREYVKRCKGVSEGKTKKPNRIKEGD